MYVLLAGLNHRTAPIDIRERLLSVELILTMLMNFLKIILTLKERLY